LILLATAPAPAQSLYTWGGNDFGQIGDGTNTDRLVPTPISGFAFGIDAVSGGYGNTLILRNGGLFGMGANGFGQLGDGTNANRSTPVAVSGLSFGVTAISGGGAHSLAIRNGAAFAWGNNDAGQLGRGFFSNGLINPEVVTNLSSGVTAVSAGANGHSVAIQNGAALAWGYNQFGQVGDGSTLNRTTPTAVSGMSFGVTAISAGLRHNLAIQNGVAVAWGWNHVGQLGDGSTIDRTTPVAVGGGLSSAVTAISAGGYHSLAVKDGAAYSWGWNHVGQLGQGDTVSRSTPTAIPGLGSGVMQVAAGEYHSFALTTDHKLYAWGYNASGQLGDGTTVTRLAPVEVPAPIGFYWNSVSAGNNHTTASLMGNAAGVYLTGNNLNGQIGDGTLIQKNSPVAAPAMNAGINAFATGGYHSLAVRNGAVFAWGFNGDGQVGDGTTTQRTAPVAVSGLASEVTAVSAGLRHSLAIRNGAALAWGSNQFGQVGNNSLTNSNVPVAVAGLTSGVTAVSAGYEHSLAVRNGAVIAWGNNANGRLGDGTTTRQNTPVAVNGLVSAVTDISAGGYHSLAVRFGEAFAWGDNDFGQLGNGNTITIVPSTPRAVSGLSSGVTAVSSGGHHSLAIKDGVAFAWGRNFSGQVGDGTTANRSTPVQVPGLPATGIIQIGAGYQHSLALTTDHRLFAWGDNTYGQFGNGTTTSSLTPVEVFAPEGFYFASFEVGLYQSAFFLAPLAPVPEPTSILGMSVLALGAVGAWRRRRAM
jgi:alpha-tubulin suppressor-like RCC1 family protein